jgi:hypothetical protein
MCDMAHFDMFAFVGHLEAMDILFTAMGWMALIDAAGSKERPAPSRSVYPQLVWLRSWIC